MTELILMYGFLYLLIYFSCSMFARIIGTTSGNFVSVGWVAWFLFSVINIRSFSALINGPEQKTVELMHGFSMSYSSFLRVSFIASVMFMAVLIVMLAISRSSKISEINAIAEESGIPEGAVSIDLIKQKYLHIAAVIYIAWLVSGVAEVFWETYHK